jgi:two-component system, NtrC family, sensor kinase
LHQGVAGAEPTQITWMPPTSSAVIIVQQIERMSVIIRGLLDFSRRGARTKQSLDLRDLCSATAALLSPLAKTADVEITLAGEALRVSVNAGEIQQVLSNLITNAVHAMPSGGLIAIAIGKTVELHDAKEQNYACITVRDGGTGIPPDVLPQIFDPFYTTKDVGQGTGLGLSVAYGIVRDHGGFIRVQSEIRKGATFRVLLPLT